MPTVTISEGTAIGGTVYAGVTDAEIASSAPNTHNSAGGSIIAKYWTSADIGYSVLQFLGLSNISGPVTVSGAVLGIKVVNTTSFADPITVHKLKVPVTVTQVTWNERQTGVAWPNGGNDASIIEAAAASATAGTGTAGAFVTWSGAGLDALVQDWINNPSTNYGLLLARLNTTPNSRETGFNSSNSGGAANRPYLTFTYTVGPPPITPNWTISSPTVDSDAGTVTLVVTLDAPAISGGFSGLVNTYDITALAGVDYVAQVAEPFFIAEGDTTGDIVITLLP